MARRVVPVDAASLVILRGRGSATEVLMGRRRPRAAFLPNVYVFPGGRLDADDTQAPPDVALRPEVDEKLRRRCRRSPAQALALAALRETFEETGLLLCGTPSARRSEINTPFWQAYETAGLTPDLGQLDYIARAITPPGSPRRFNTRFFITRGDEAKGKLLQDGELLDLRWVSLVDIDNSALKVIDVTRFVLQQAEIFMSATPGDRERRPVTLMQYVGGRRRYVHE